jgi:hypothetical protein
MATAGPWPGYTARSVTETLLYQTVERYWPQFVERTQGLGTLPSFVRREFEDFLKCGRLEEAKSSVIVRGVCASDVGSSTVCRCRANGEAGVRAASVDA